MPRKAGPQRTAKKRMQIQMALSPEQRGDAMHPLTGYGAVILEEVRPRSPQKQRSRWRVGNDQRWKLKIAPVSQPQDPNPGRWPSMSLCPSANTVSAKFGVVTPSTENSGHAKPVTMLFPDCRVSLGLLESIASGGRGACIQHEPSLGRSAGWSDNLRLHEDQLAVTNEGARESRHR